MFMGEEYSPIATDITLTPCAKNGKTGPTEVECDAAYTWQPQVDGISVDNAAIRNGIQTVTFSMDGMIAMEVGGAGGGYGRGMVEMRGGRGAKAFSLFKVTKGQSLKVVVGQAGIKRAGWDDADYFGGAGGGGTFVWDPEDDSLPWIVAGGGGGASYAGSKEDRNYWGRDGRQDGNGGKACPTGDAGGRDGEGGATTQQSSYRGGAGAGWKSNGNCNNYQTQVCGLSKGGNFVGGDTNSGGHGEGGFGGGAGCYRQGGGGGGFSGGSGGHDGHGAGGGGGSFSNGESVEVYPGGNRMYDGA